MSKGFLLCILLCICVLSGYAQTLNVRDMQTQMPLASVTVTASNGEVIGVTDQKGEFDLKNLRHSERLILSYVGYKPVRVVLSDLEKMSYTISMELSSIALDQVVVSGTRWQQSQADLPQKIDRISPSEVAFYNSQTAADLLGISNTVFIQKSQQGGGSPMIRGFSTNRLLYTIDGVRMNTAIFRGGNLQNVISLDPFAMQNTEVLFGPGSVIYGSDAIGGVMSFETLQAKLSLTDEMEFSGHAALRYSSANNEKTGHIDLSVAGKRWGWIGSFSRFDYGDLRQGGNGPDDFLKTSYPARLNGQDILVTQDEPLLQVPSGYDQTNVMQKLRFKPNAVWEAIYGFHYSETSSYGRYDRHNRTRNGTARYAEWDYGPQKWMMNHLSLKYLAGNNLFDKATLNLAQQSFAESRISRDFNNPLRQIWEEDVQAYTVNLDLTKRVNQHTFFYGMEYVLNKVTSLGKEENIENGSVVDAQSRYPQADWQSLAFYVTDELKLSEKMTLSGGLRWSTFAIDADFNTDFFSFPFEKAELNNAAVTGSMGFSYRPEPSLVLRANAGTAFRAPNVDDIGKIFDSEPGSVVVPNPDLEAEFAYNFDLGVAKQFFEQLKIEVTGYYTRLNNALVRRDFQLNGADEIFFAGQLSQVQAIQNAAKSDRFGLQFGVDWNISTAWFFALDVNWQEGADEMDDGSISPGRHVAPTFGATSLRYSIGKLMLEANLGFQGEFSHADLSVEERNKSEIYALDANGNTFAHSWYTLNFKSQINISETLSLQMGVENITDQRYRPYSSGISGAGRNFVISIRGQF